MIIIDTSVWIDFLKGDQEIRPLFNQILENRYVIALSAVFGELLQGVRNDREMEIIQSFWYNLPKIDEENLFIKAGLLCCKYEFITKGVGLIDCFILAASLENNAEIWTLDRKLNQAIELIT
ncbi:PIN domain-containing protein [Bacteroidota bacterium]